MALEHSSSTPPQHTVDFETVGSSYFQERELKKGAAGWVLLGFFENPSGQNGPQNSKSLYKSLRKH